MIVFDIDDTLYNEIDYVKSGYKVVSKYIENKYDLNNIYLKMIELFNKSSKNIFNRLLDSLNIEYTNEDIIELVNIYRNHFPSIKLTGEVIDILMKLKEKYILCIVSDGNYNTQYLKCKALELDKYFDEIILTDKYGKKFWKPSRKSFDLLSKNYSIKLSNIYYVGDNPNKDFYISKYGINTIRFYNKKGIYYNDKYLKDVKEKYKIYCFKDILKIIANDL